MIERNTLIQRQRLPLEVKVRMTRSRIEAFVEEYGIENVYVSFSGGKDSTVLLDIARSCYKDILAVFDDTWMEYPGIRRFIKTYQNVEVLKPEKTMKQIIDECGWCFPGKDVADAVDNYGHTRWAVKKLHGLDMFGNESVYRQRYKKWLPLTEAPFKVSGRCCFEMKEKVFAKYEKQTGRHPILALMAQESGRRREAYLRTGCNAFDAIRPLSKPMGFWTEQDVLEYIYTKHLAIAEPYGEVLKEDGRYYTTGEQRTGCIFCPVGCHLDHFQKYYRLKEQNPVLFEYCMDGLGLRKVLHWIEENYHCGKAPD